MLQKVSNKIYWQIIGYASKITTSYAKGTTKTITKNTLKITVKLRKNGIWVMAKNNRKITVFKQRLCYGEFL